MTDVRRQRVSSVEESLMVDSQGPKPKTMLNAVPFLMGMSESMVQFFGE